MYSSSVVWLSFSFLVRVTCIVPSLTGYVDAAFDDDNDDDDDDGGGGDDADDHRVRVRDRTRAHDVLVCTFMMRKDSTYNPPRQGQGRGLLKMKSLSIKRHDSMMNTIVKLNREYLRHDSGGGDVDDDVIMVIVRISENKKIRYGVVFVESEFELTLSVHLSNHNGNVN